MVLATGIAGACLAAVHTPAGQMVTHADDKAEYTLFTALLDLLALLVIPAGGLQAIFAQMTARALNEVQRAELRAAVRRVLLVVTVAWLVMLLAIWMTRAHVLAGLKVSNPMALWLTLTAALMGLWTPVFAGLLQGSQRFFWLGNTLIAGAIGRLIGVAIAVVGWGALSVGAMGGVLFGAVLSLGLAAWISRDQWAGPVRAPRGWPWVRPWIALTLGLTAGGVMLSFDTLVVQNVFEDDQKNFYAAAGRIGRGLVALTTPLALVLFPKVARSAATGEPTAALKLALGATLGTGAAVAIGCTLFPALPIRILFAGNPRFLPAAELVPLFCWCMLPLTAAYTLVNNLLARSRYAVVPWLLLVAGLYTGTLWSLRGYLASQPMFDAFRMVITVLGAFSLLLLAVAVLFSFRRSAATKAVPPA
jgi:O-antigen/teichoic acid export membrane protein